MNIFIHIYIYTHTALIVHTNGAFQYIHVPAVRMAIQPSKNHELSEDHSNKALNSLFVCTY